MGRSGFWTGALTGGLLTAILVGVLYLGHQLAGLPFPPFDAFDWITRRLPGGVLTTAIDAMVSLIERLGVGPTSVVAKASEQAMAVVGFLAAGALAGGVFFATRLGSTRALGAGLVAGTLAGAALAALGVATGSSPAPVAGVLWTSGLLLVWGGVLATLHERLEPAPRDASASAELHAEAIDRRTLLVRLGAATAAVTVTGAVVAVLSAGRRSGGGASAGGALPWSATNRLPNADAAVQPVRGTRPELTPVSEHYRIDINTRAPRVDPDAWRLRVSGLVETPLELSLAELRSHEPIHQLVTLSCISNRIAGDLIGTTRWTGVSLQRLLPDLGLGPGATHLRLRSVDGFHEVVDLDVIRADARVMLCYEWDGLPLTREHGSPLRIYIPDRYGMKQPKWIESLEALDHWEAGYWVLRGWDRDARVEATAVIDAVATDMMMTEMSAGASVPVGGIAYAGARGISRVELQVDGGAWAPAALRDPLSETSWVLWRFDWPFQPGKHTLTVRCFDGAGAPQTVEPSPPHPDGATGLHSVEAML